MLSNIKWFWNFTTSFWKDVNAVCYAESKASRLTMWKGSMPFDLDFSMLMCFLKLSPK